jgi:glycosyltransferase involved in cell wall biosynthesis
MIRLGIYREVFAASDYTLFLTLEERRLVEKVCAKPSAGEIGGLGWELPALKPRDARQPTDPYLLYVGRVDHPKGCGELLEFFRHRPPELADLRLLLVGRVMMETRLDPNVHALGYVEEEEKDQLLEGALALVMPSPYESLSLVLLESWARGIPVIANGRCQALRGQCERSDGGLVYNDLGSFQRAVRALFDDPPLRLLLGLRGRRYVRRVYSWEKAEQCYERALEAVSRENRRLPAA